VSYFHEEQQFRQWWLWALLAAAALPVIVVVAIRGPVLSVLIVPLLLLAVGALLAFARLVVDVDREAVTVAFHFLAPKRRIALSTVRRAQATKYRPLLDYGGYGVRLGFRGWAFNVSGDEGVLVETNDGSRVMIGSQRPRELEAAIAQAIRERVPPIGGAEPH
jgi:hypothetical protein